MVDLVEFFRGLQGLDVRSHEVKARISDVRNILEKSCPEIVNNDELLNVIPKQKPIA
ncbi:UNVERIFIED_ORG: hypothetical protein GGE63_002739 [Rhizobium esperanzae]